jgi:hypothetical protein
MLKRRSLFRPPTWATRSSQASDNSSSFGKIHVQRKNLVARRARHVRRRCWRRHVRPGTGAGNRAASRKADRPRRSDRLLDQARRRRRRTAGADGHRRRHQAQRRHQHRRTADHPDRERHGRRKQPGRRRGPVDLWPVQRQPARPGFEQDPGAGQRPPPRQLRHRRHRRRRQLDPAGLDRPRGSAEGRRIRRVRLRRDRRRHQLHHPPELPGRGSDRLHQRQPLRRRPDPQGQHPGRLGRFRRRPLQHHAVGRRQQGQRHLRQPARLRATGWNNNGLRDSSATPSGNFSTFDPVTTPNADAAWSRTR